MVENSFGLDVGININKLNFVTEDVVGNRTITGLSFIGENLIKPLELLGPSFSDYRSTKLDTIR